MTYAVAEPEERYRVAAPHGPNSRWYARWSPNAATIRCW